jgi:tetratricopeptide (TPR) repeat protein
MDSIDFSSWDEKEDKTNPLCEFDRKFYDHYCEQVKCAKNICIQFKSELKGDINTETLNDLFCAKLDRLKARRSFEPDDIRNKYIDSAYSLQKALNHISLDHFKKSSQSLRKKDLDWLLILLYNDLSICYSGLKNSSLSRGYAEQSIELIKKDEDYIDFQNKIKFSGDQLTNNQNLKFVNGKTRLYDLYTNALFCRGLAESGLSLKEEAEKTFRQIIHLGDKHNFPKNSDYSSACFHLAVMLIDLSRGEEAIELLEKCRGLGEKDYRWAESRLETASAQIDQSRYEEAQKTLKELINDRPNAADSNAESILDGQICCARSYLEKARNLVKNNKENKSEIESLFKKAIEKLQIACEKSRKRQQKNLIQKAAKYLAEIHNEMGKMDDALNYYSISLSEDKIKNFRSLLDDKSWHELINDCEDTRLLENFSKICYKKIIDTPDRDEKISSFCLALLKKLKKECEEKENQLDLAERAERRIEEINSVDIHPETLKEHNFSKSFNKLTHRSDPDVCLKEKFESLVDKIRGCEKTDDNPKKELRFCTQLLTGALIHDRLMSNEKTFDNALFGRTPSKIQGNGLVELIILRRWNSFSPSLSRRYAVSLGGGYLLRIRKLKPDNTENLWFNVVIDPGYNFLLNFHSENFKVQDIDAVVVTHSHSDHCAELSGIMDLIHQINKRRNKIENESEENKVKKRIYLLLSKGVYKKFSPYIPDWKEQLKDVILLENNSTWIPPDFPFEIKAMETAHADLGGVKAIGILVTIKQDDKILIGFTGDTPWRKNIRDNFKKCDLLCLHMGGIKEWEIGYDEDNNKIPFKKCQRMIESEIKQANHLLFYGSKDIIDNCEKKNSLVLVGEFGEELKYGLRADLVEKLTPPRGPLCIPADTGLYLIITDTKDKKIRCDFCGRFVSDKEIRVFAYGIVDSLHYICEACHHTLNESQKRTVIESALTRH